MKRPLPIPTVESKETPIKIFYLLLDYDGCIANEDYLKLYNANPDWREQSESIMNANKSLLEEIVKEVESKGYNYIIPAIASSRQTIDIDNNNAKKIREISGSCFTAIEHIQNYFETKGLSTALSDDKNTNEELLGDIQDHLPPGGTIENAKTKLNIETGLLVEENKAANGQHDRKTTQNSEHNNIAYFDENKFMLIYFKIHALAKAAAQKFPGREIQIECLFLDDNLKILACLQQMQAYSFLLPRGVQLTCLPYGSTTSEGEIRTLIEAKEAASFADVKQGIEIGVPIEGTGPIDNEYRDMIYWMESFSNMENIGNSQASIFDTMKKFDINNFLNSILLNGKLQTQTIEEFHKEFHKDKKNSLIKKLLEDYRKIIEISASNQEQEKLILLDIVGKFEKCYDLAIFPVSIEQKDKFIKQLRNWINLAKNNNQSSAAVLPVLTSAYQDYFLGLTGILAQSLANDNGSYTDQKQKLLQSFMKEIRDFLTPKSSDISYSYSEWHEAAVTIKIAETIVLKSSLSAVKQLKNQAEKLSGVPGYRTQIFGNIMIITSSVLLFKLAIIGIPAGLFLIGCLAMYYGRRKDLSKKTFQFYAKLQRILLKEKQLSRASQRPGKNNLSNVNAADKGKILSSTDPATTPRLIKV